MSIEAEARAVTRGRGGRPSRLQSAQLSDRILDVATGFFLGEGYGATSIEAIARRARISKRTFYHRFNGKEMLFETVVRRLIERWTPRVDTDLLQAPSLAETLRRAAESMLDAALTEEALALYRIAITEAKRFPALARILHDLGASTGIERLAQQIEAGVARGELAPLDPSERRRWIERTVALFLDGCRRGLTPGPALIY